MNTTNKYANGKIYKLVDKTQNDKILYVGSTVLKLE